MPKVAIICAIPVEFIEIRKFVKDITEVTHPEGSVYEQGIFEEIGQKWEVLLVEAGAGNAAAALATQRAIDFFKPDIVLFVGVAGGIKDVTLGDVVVASSVHGYEKGKAAKEFEPRPEAGLGNYALVERARAEARKEKQTWLDRLETAGDAPSKIVVGEIVAGEKVVTSNKNETAAIIAKHFSAALAVEMEGKGFYDAIRLCGNSQIQGLLIRGISDMVTNKAASDAAGWQPKAARNAAAVAFEILSKTTVRTTSLAAETHSVTGELTAVRNKLLKERISLSSAILLVYGITQNLLAEQDRAWLRHEMDGYTVEELLAFSKLHAYKLHTVRMQEAELVATHLTKGPHHMCFPNSAEEAIFSLVAVTQSIQQIEQILESKAAHAEISLVAKIEQQLRSKLVNDMAHEKGREAAQEYVAMMRFKHHMSLLVYTKIVGVTRTHLLELIDKGIAKAADAVSEKLDP